MPPKKPACSPDADAVPDAVERLADEVRTLRTALDEFQDSFTYELRRFRDTLADVMGHRPEVNADDFDMTIDGVRSAARQVERAAEFPGETSDETTDVTQPDVTPISSKPAEQLEAAVADSSSGRSAAGSQTPARSGKLF